jgi:endonuclease YncB( thermonuclease family)
MSSNNCFSTNASTSKGEVKIDAKAGRSKGNWPIRKGGVSDGDTIKVHKDGKQVKIRLAAIDCPEKKQPYGQKAKQFTAGLVAGKVVKVSKEDQTAVNSSSVQEK